MNCPRCGARMNEGAKFCTVCGGKMEAIGGGAAAPAAHQAAPEVFHPRPGVDAIFSYDKYLYRQPMVAVRDKYDIFDEQGTQILYAQRTIFALKRHVNIFAAHDRQNPIMKILQENIISFLSLNFTLVDGAGAPLARFKRLTWISMLRRTWEVYGPDGTALGQVIEDSWFKALFRRFGPFGELMRTDFDFIFGGRTIGKFHRKMTIRDMYTLDLTGDPERTLDRRVALAISILLDSAERR